MSSTLLQLFLLVIVFCIGVCATLAVQYAMAHFHLQKHAEPEHKPAPPKDVEMPAEMKQHLLEKSQANFQAVLDNSAKVMEQDLGKTAGELNKVLQQIGTQVVGSEMERYRQQLDEIRQQAAGAIGGAQQEIAKHQAELKAQLEQQHAELKAKLREEILAEKQKEVQAILAEKQLIIKQIDERLADSVASFLIETLGHNVDLGAQQAYLTALLEEHKDDFKREVSS